jgi:hypothetical protein
VIGDLRDEFYDQLKKKGSTFILIADVKNKQKYRPGAGRIRPNKGVSTD